jgi:hypothetical protein
MIDASKPTSKHTWLAAVLAALISAPFVGLNAVASKLLFSPAAPAHFDAVSLFVARGFWSLPLFLVLALATMPHALPPLTWRNAGLFAMCGITYGPGTNALSALNLAYDVNLTQGSAPERMNEAALFMKDIRLASYDACAIYHCEVNGGITRD